MEDGIRQSKASVRKNLMIAFLLIVVMFGASLTWVFNSALHGILGEYELARDVSTQINNDFAMISIGMTMAGIVIFLSVAWFLSGTIVGPAKKLDKASETARSAHILGDIAENRELERTRRLAEMGKFVTHMAHEINNPLTVISGRAQIELMKDIKDEELKEALLAIVKASDNTKAIMQRFLRFARPGKGTATGVNINDVISEIVDFVEHQFQTNNIEVRKSLLPAPILCTLDPKQLQEVVMNLVNNAREAIPEAGSIEITTSIQDKWAKIEVKDSGSGMDECALDKIGDLFYTTKKHGSGMGLSIVFNILKAYGGSLRFVSTPGKGTTATVLLPLQ